MSAALARVPPAELTWQSSDDACSSRASSPGDGATIDGLARADGRGDGERDGCVVGSDVDAAEGDGSGVGKGVGSGVGVGLGVG